MDPVLERVVEQVLCGRTAAVVVAGQENSLLREQTPLRLRAQYDAASKLKNPVIRRQLLDF